MGEMTRVYSGSVHPDWIDYNGHMGDYAYAIIFSDALTSFMDMIGVDSAYRSHTACTIYTLEIRIAYLNECHLGQKFHVLQQLLDIDTKRFHAFLRMIDSETGQDLAICEQLLMHMQQSPGEPPRAKDFPKNVAEKLALHRHKEAGLEVPEWVGSRVGIRRKQ
jgi:acyl-CoA thioester hydrolase